jgi:hypothetical protein
VDVEVDDADSDGDVVLVGVPPPPPSFVHFAGAAGAVPIFRTAIAARITVMVTAKPSLLFAVSDMGSYLP